MKSEVLKRRCYVCDTLKALILALLAHTVRMNGQVFKISDTQCTNTFFPTITFPLGKKTIYFTTSYLHFVLL